MSAPRHHILILLLMAGCLHAAAAQEQPAAEQAALEIDTQLRIYRTTLLENKSEQRIDAATLLLYSDNPDARKILLDVLKQTDNPGARAAICTALNPTRTWQKPVKNKEDFIKPLISIIVSEEDVATARLAAEATLIFGYSQIQVELEKAANDASLPTHAKLNVIYALRRHPDKQAVAKLLSLVDSPDATVADAARNALAAVGIAAGPDPATRRPMMTELQQRGTEAFLRERVIRQETRMRELEADLSTWQTRYSTALGRLYNALADEAARNAFLTEQLSAPEMPVKLWALAKLEELRKGTGKLKLSEQLEAVLLSLISDPSRQVRLRTARLLALMGELNSAKPLLAQLPGEPDDQVRREMFVALGATCYFASLPTAGRRIPEEVRRETLEWAVKFLAETGPEKARSGAEVIGKLLEQDGLKPEEVDRYLKAISDRYAQATAGADNGLRSYLLGAMAGLCTTRSTCRVEAAKLYNGLFEQAISDEAEGVRQSGVDGLISVDKSSALRRLRKDIIADPSLIIRLKLLDLAGEVGGPQDLDWLVEKLGTTGETEQAWQAMLKVFRRSGLTVLADWVARVEIPPLAGRISVEQKQSFFTLVEQRSQSEDNPDLLKQVQQDLVQLYISSNNLNQAADYLKTLLSAAAANPETERLRSQLLYVYLASSSFDQAGELIGVCLSDKDSDLSPDGFVVRSIEEYLNRPSGADPNALLKALERVQIKDPQSAGVWRGLVSRWADRFAKARKAEDADRVSN